MPRYNRSRSSFLKEIGRLDKINRVVQETSWDNTNVSYNVGDRRTTEVKTSVNDFVDEIESVEDNPRPANIMERLIELSENSFLETPQQNMYKLIEILDERTYGYPQPGDIFTFIYRAKTPKLIYDMHPVTRITQIGANSFWGWNYHLNMVRQYKGGDGRILSNFYKIDEDELPVVLSINTKLLLKT